MGDVLASLLGALLESSIQTEGDTRKMTDFMIHESSLMDTKWEN